MSIPPPMQCIKCEFNTLEDRKMSYHVKICPKCPFCNFKTSRPDYLKKHIEQHSNPKTIICEECDFLCSATTTMIRHKKSHSYVMRYKCDDCGKYYRQLDSLKYHYIKKHDKIYSSKKS